MQLLFTTLQGIFILWCIATVLVVIYGLYEDFISNREFKERMARINPKNWQ